MSTDTKTETLSFLELIKQIDEEERVQRDRGTLFEILTKVYLENEPMYHQLFDSVWLLKDVPAKYGIPKKDTGVDLVAKKRNSEELFAIQSKYYASDYKIRKVDIDSFLNEVGKKYYSGGIIVTSAPYWTNNAEEAINDRDKKISRIDLTQLQESRVDWSQFSFSEPDNIELHIPKKPRPYQREAVKAVLKGFESADRGKLVMAPGTGKTYTSMVIAEKLAEEKEETYKVLYLVPSIQLLSQALKGWSADTKYTMDTIAVCSDRKVTKQSGSTELEDIAAADIGYPATTDYQKLLKYQSDIEETSSKGDMLVVFSTYQSIDVIIEAQKNGFYDFDLIISDEAHRTTGATEKGKEDSHFVKVHYNSNVKADKRLYQTATPRVYTERALEKASETETQVYDMDEPEIFGEEFYYLGFGDAVHNGILSDYKVMVLAVEEEMVQKEIQRVFADENNELQFDDVTKIIGTWNGLLKRKSNSNELYGEPMKRAIAFTGTIQKSKEITRKYQQIINEYVDDEDATNAFKVDIKHADGTMNALEKNQKLDWLKAEVPENTVKILSNARFLTEGVDVPDLDAVLFLQPRRSEIDIAQAVGRVMRKSDNKEYGYVILPIGVPEGVSANQVLDNNEKYAVVWDILNALRSIDERFDAMINKLELNKKKPGKINVIGVGEAPVVNDETREYKVESKDEQLELELDENLSDLECAIFGKVVDKVGTIKYWESWSKDVAKIAEQHITRIKALLESNKKVEKAFKNFINGLRSNINSSISVSETIEMLAQHLITKPVFDSLFENETFALNNPISLAMSKMIDLLVNYGLDREQEELSGFYESVRLRAEGIDNLEAKQTIIIELYQKFFKAGFPNTADRLGIVFTPTEVVDFIIHSVEDAVQKHLGTSMNNKNVNILDPFTGTGTFITRLLQSGIISKDRILYKYMNEIYANEVVLLSYYIAAINIEETFKEISEEDYIPFPGIVLTDTFESTEQELTLDDKIFTDNNERLRRQQEVPINVILGNPPYTAKQTSDNNNNQRGAYKKLDESIFRTYFKNSNTNNPQSLYDSYIRAFRWATNKVGKKGIIGFITNNSFLDGRTMSGVRHSFENEFDDIYIFNLRGQIRGVSSDEQDKEGENVFNIQTGVAITILVKNGSGNGTIKYFETPDYMSRKEKLNYLKTNRSLFNLEPQEILTSDENNDWFNKRNIKFDDVPKLVATSVGENALFFKKGTGIQTKRDDWVYDFSEENLYQKTLLLEKNYNLELEKIDGITTPNERSQSLTDDENKVKWGDKLRRNAVAGKQLDIDKNNIIEVMYRPFTRKYLTYDTNIIDRPGKAYQIFEDGNIAIVTTGKGAKKGFSSIVVDKPVDTNVFQAGCQIYPKNDFENNTNPLFETLNMNENLLEFYGVDNLDDMFAYVYALFHSAEYKVTFQNDLLKDVPKIPKVKKASEYVEIGHKLIKLHLNYDKQQPLDEVTINYHTDKPEYSITKMKYGNKKDSSNKNVKDYSVIKFNKDITIENIPLKAYDYIVNGYPAIRWFRNQYVKGTSISGFPDNPNDFKNSKYPLELLLSLISVSVKTIDLINSLPSLKIIE